MLASWANPVDVSAVSAPRKGRSQSKGARKAKGSTLQRNIVPPAIPEKYFLSPRPAQITEERHSTRLPEQQCPEKRVKWRSALCYAGQTSLDAAMQNSIRALR